LYSIFMAAFGWHNPLAYWSTTLANNMSEITLYHIILRQDTQNATYTLGIFGQKAYL
jgi:hypothetical protein